MDDGSSLSKLPPVERYFAMNLKRLRKERGLSQEALAAQLKGWGWGGFNQMTVSRIEKGERTVSLSEADALAVALSTLVEHMKAPPATVKLIENLSNSVQALHATVEDQYELLVRGADELEAAKEALSEYEKAGHDAQDGDERIALIKAGLARDFVRELSLEGVYGIVKRGNQLFIERTEGSDGPAP